MPEPGPGQMLLRTLYLSLDPYMRGRMNAAKSYAKPVEVGEVMEGGTVSEVVASHHARLRAGRRRPRRRPAGRSTRSPTATGLRKLDPSLGARLRPRSACSACRA